MKKKSVKALGHWETSSLRIKLGEIKQQINEMELDHSDPMTFTNQRSKNILKYLQTKYSEVEQEIQRRYA